jgi:MFS family permease
MIFSEGGSSMNSKISTPKTSNIYWLIAGITFLTLLVSAGVRSTPGILIIPLEEAFGWDRASITLPLAINLMLYGLCGPFAAAFMERYGVKRIMIFSLSLLALGTSLSSFMTSAWQMFMLWGVTIGIGTGLSSSVLGAVVANRWFKERRGLIVGMFTASVATGQLIFLPLFAKVVTTYHWQAVVWVTCISSLIVIGLVMCFMRDKPSDLGMQPYGANEVEHPEEQELKKTNPFISAFHGLKIGIRSKNFWLLSISFFICGLSTNGLIGTHFIPVSIDHGIPELRAAGMLAIMGIFDIFGTIGSGWLTDRWDSRWLLFWYYGFRGISLLILPFTFGESSIALILFIVFYGLDWVATVPPTVRLASDVFGQQSSIVFGWIWAAHQLGAATAAFGGGILHSVFGNYDHTFIMAGVFCFVASGLVINIGKKKLVSASPPEKIM